MMMMMFRVVAILTFLLLRQNTINAVFPLSKRGRNFIQPSNSLLLTSRYRSKDCCTLSMRGGGRADSNIENNSTQWIPRPTFKAHFSCGFAHLCSSSYYNPAKETTNKETVVPPLKTKPATKGTIQHRGENNSQEMYRIGKMVGIALGIPIYMTVRLLQLGWVLPCLRLVDTLVAKSIGLLLDTCMHLYCLTIWLIVTYALIPTAKVIWIPIGMGLELIYGAIKYINNNIVRPFLHLWMLTYTGLIQYAAKIAKYLNHVIFRPLLCLLLIATAAVKAQLILLNQYVGYVMTTYLITPLLTYVIIPFYEGACGGYGTTAKLTNKFVISPLLCYILKPIWRAIFWSTTFLFWRCFARPLLQVIISIGRTARASFTFVYRNTLLPLVRVFQMFSLAVTKPIKLILVAINKKCYDTYLVIKLLSVFLYSKIKRVVKETKDMVKDLILIFSRNPSKDSVPEESRQ